MKPEMECVLSALRGYEAIANVSVQVLEDAFTLADHERVLPLFLSKMRANATMLPAESQTKLSAAEKEIAVETFWWTAELKGILKAFASADVRVILLKGPCFAARVYGSTTLRTSRDIDILVRDGDLMASRAVLEDLQFSPGDNNGFHQRWRRSSTMVEMHVGVSRPDEFAVGVEAMCSRARMVTFAGECAYILSPPDELLFMCLHGVRHQFDRLGYIVDILLALRQFGPEANRDALELHPGAAIILGLGCTLARRLQAIGPAIDARKDDALPPQTNRIADLLWSRITQNAPLPYLWRFRLRIHLSSQPNRRSQIRYLWTAWLSVGEADLVFANKLKIKSNNLMWLARQLRLFLRIFHVGLRD